MTKYPDIEVVLSGSDGNAFSIIARVTQALKRGGAAPDDVQAFIDEATSGDYDNVLSTCMSYVEVL